MADGKTTMRIGDDAHAEFVDAKPEGVTHTWFIKKLVEVYREATADDR